MPAKDMAKYMRRQNVKVALTVNGETLTVNENFFISLLKMLLTVKGIGLTVKEVETLTVKAEILTVKGCDLTVKEANEPDNSRVSFGFDGQNSAQNGEGGEAMVST